MRSLGYSFILASPPRNPDVKGILRLQLHLSLLPPSLTISVGQSADALEANFRTPHTSAHTIDVARTATVLWLGLWSRFLCRERESAHGIRVHDTQKKGWVRML